MPMQQNTFNAMIPEMQLSFPNFQDQGKNQEHFPNIYSKINVNVTLLVSFKPNPDPRTLGSCKT